eukprot:gene15284-10623_t
MSAVCHIAFRVQPLPGRPAIAVRDAGATVAACAAAVGVGSLSDPREWQGLAHFLEHMLFEGSDRYPGAGNELTR